MDRKGLLLSIGVGVSAAALGGAIYALMISKSDSLDSHNHTSSRPLAIEMKIAEKHAGIVIGRGGENIREIQRKTNTKIFFKDELATETERFLVIRGQPDEAQLAEILIHQTIANQPRSEVVTLKVPSECIGRLIGKKGENIRRMQSQTKCKIDIPKDEVVSAGEKKSVILKGTSEQISHAKRLISKEVEDELLFQRKYKHSAQNRAPRIKYKQPLFLTSDNDANLDSSSLSSEAGRAGYEKLRVSYGEKTVGVMVSSVSDPEHFYVQQVGPRSIYLDKLVEEMTSFYNTDVNKQLHGIQKIEAGDFVAAQWPGDNQWYRAKVVETQVDEYDDSKVTVEVDFLDFGDCDSKDKSELCQLKSEFLKLKFQAIDCCLSNVKSKYGCNWSSEAIEEFERLTFCAQWKELQAEIVGYKQNENQNQSDASPLQIPIIDLMNTNSDQVIRIGHELVRLGLADFIQCDTLKPDHQNGDGWNLKSAEDGKGEEQTDLNAKASEQQENAESQV